MIRSHLEILSEIKDFIYACKKDKDLVGFNVMLSKHKGKSYVIGKVNTSFKPKYVLPIDLDYFDPIQRSMISGAIHHALYGKKMTAEEAEKDMISKIN